VKPDASSAIKGRLRPLQSERHIVIAIRYDIIQVAIPSLARIEPQLLGAFALQQVEGAFDVLGGERLAVVPFDVLAQLEGQLLAVLAPRPFAGEIGHDRLDAGLRLVLVVHDEVIEHAHRRTLTGDGGLLMDRHRGGAVEEVHLQRPARLLRECAAACRHAAEQYPGQRERSREQIHWRPSPCSLGLRGRARRIHGRARSGQ